MLLLLQKGRKKEKILMIEVKLFCQIFVHNSSSAFLKIFLSEIFYFKLKSLNLNNFI